MRTMSGRNTRRLRIQLAVTDGGVMPQVCCKYCSAGSTVVVEDGTSHLGPEIGIGTMSFSITDVSIQMGQLWLTFSQIHPSMPHCFFTRSL